MVNSLRKDYRTAPISEQDRTMLDYVVKLTKDATQCSPEDHLKLRAVGFDDRGIGVEVWCVRSDYFSRNHRMGL